MAEIAETVKKSEGKQGEAISTGSLTSGWSQQRGLDKEGLKAALKNDTQKPFKPEKDFDGPASGRDPDRD